MADAHQLRMLAPPLSTSDVPTSDDRCTPPEILTAVAELWPRGIDLDPCSNPWSLVQARTRWDRSDDALGRDWELAAGEGGTIWLNPPFSDPTPFVERLPGIVQSIGGEGLLLVRHDSTTKWWTRIEVSADAICLLRTRVRFRLAGEDTGPADHATTIAFFTRRAVPHKRNGSRGQRVAAFIRAFTTLGLVCEVQR